MFKEKITVFASTVTGKTIDIDIEPSAMVEMLKEKIREKQGIPLKQQELRFNGIKLADHNTLEDYN